MSKNEHCNNLIISTGSKQLDEHFSGGFVCGSVIGISGGANSGKSNVARSFALNSLKSEDEFNRNFNNKVFHLSLDNSNDLELYLSGLLNKDIAKISKEDIQKGLSCYQDRLIVKQLSSPLFDLNDLDFLVMQIYQSFRFNVLVIDYPQLMIGDTALIFASLKKIALKFDCIVYAPIQTYTTGSYSLTNSKLNSCLDILFSCHLDSQGDLSLNLLKDKQSSQANCKFTFTPDFSTRNWIV